MAARLPLEVPGPDLEAACRLPLAPARRAEFEVGEGTWISLDLTPDGETIVFELLGDLWLLPAAGGEARAITGSMAFHSQPSVSPDGRRVAFVSDLSGADNVWTASLEGSAPVQVTGNDGPHSFVSPAWSPDGGSLCVSLYRADRNATELWRYPAGGGEGTALAPRGRNVLGAVFAPDGGALWCAARDGPVFEDDVAMPRWRIDRLGLRDGRWETIVANPGGAFRPRLSPDGRRLVYGARRGGQTGLRLRDLASGDDRWLSWPVEPDAQEALPTRDLMPAFAFAPDGAAIVAAWGGRIRRIDLASGAAVEIPFRARVSRGLGPQLRRDLAEESGPVQSRIASWPALSPDGARVAYGAFARVHVRALDGAARSARPLTEAPSFMPAWSPCGRWLAYVTWTAREAGHAWLADADGASPPTRVTDVAAFYTHPVVCPDGASVLALRSSSYERMHLPMDPFFTGRALGTLRQAELVAIPIAGGPARVVASGMMSGPPHFTEKEGSAFLLFDDGLNEVRLDGSGRRAVVQVVGPGYYFLEGPQPADDIRISPDGRRLIVQHVQQLHLVDLPPETGEVPVVDLSEPGPGHRRLTTEGADFFGWSGDGAGVFWALGAGLYRAALDGPAPAGERRVSTSLAVAAPRDRPEGSLLLRGATAITMRGGEVIARADILVEGGRIAAIGPAGAVAAPPGAEVRDLAGAFVLPGFVDAHAHYGAIRRGVLDLHEWCLAACLAYGVTSGLDPSTLSIDLISLQDLQEAGEILAPRLYSTGVAVFSYNRFGSLAEARDGLVRYARDYRTGNLKQYRTGGRRVRQWVAMAARELGLMPTTEGALDARLDLTQVIDGFAGNEHALGPMGLGADVVGLMAAARTSYVLTLQCTHGGPQGLNAFIAAGRPLADPKLRRFFPAYMLERLFARVPWTDPQEHVHARVAAGALALLRAGGLVGVGSHGNVAGLGMHWELFAHVDGGFSAHEALRAATIGSAETIGRERALGSLETGKLADLLVMSRDPLADIRNTLSLTHVMQNGRLYDAATLAELWPRQRPPPVFWFENDDPTGA